MGLSLSDGIALNAVAHPNNALSQEAWDDGLYEARAREHTATALAAKLEPYRHAYLDVDRCISPEVKRILQKYDGLATQVGVSPAPDGLKRVSAGELTKNIYGTGYSDINALGGWQLPAEYTREQERREANDKYMALSLENRKLKQALQYENEKLRLANARCDDLAAELAAFKAKEAEDAKQREEWQKARVDTTAYNVREWAAMTSGGYTLATALERAGNGYHGAELGQNSAAMFDDYDSEPIIQDKPNHYTIRGW